jgi:hypothetical protein
MKKLLLLIFVYWACLGFSQEKEIGKFHAGLSFGAVATDINGADPKDGDNDFQKLGLTAGLLVNTKIAKSSIIQLELNYIQKGTMQRPDSLNHGYLKIALHYIEIPILIRQQIHFNYKGRRVNRVDLLAGVSVGRMIYNQSVDSTNSILPKEYVNKYYNSTDVSLLGGVCINVSKRFLIDLRYTNSLIPVIHKNPINAHFFTYTFNKGNNMVFQMCLKFVFGPKGENSRPKDKPADQ